MPWEPGKTFNRPDAVLFLFLRLVQSFLAAAVILERMFVSPFAFLDGVHLKDKSCDLFGSKPPQTLPGHLNERNLTAIEAFTLICSPFFMPSFHTFISDLKKLYAHQTI